MTNKRQIESAPAKRRGLPARLAGLALLAMMTAGAAPSHLAHAAAPAGFVTVVHGGHFGGGHGHFARHEFRHHDRFGWGGCGPYSAYDPYKPYAYCW